MKAESKELKAKKSDRSSFSLSALNFKLKIGYDGKRAANNLTGLGNYSRALIEHLAVQFPDNQYFIYTPKIKLSISNFSVFLKKNIKLLLPPKGMTKLFWRSFKIKEQLVADQIDLFHGLSHEIPFGIRKTGIKSIVTIHDLIFLRHPKYYKRIDRFIYKIKSSYACRYADRIIAISEKTKEDIIELYHSDPAKIDVIYQSCDDSFKTAVPLSEKKRIQAQYQLPQKYLLNVGTIEARKNLLQLIKALPSIDPSYQLVVIGKPTAYNDLVLREIELLQLKDKVIFLKNVPFKDLPGIYQMATLFVMPSYYEGFGIPIIEALYCNVPVIAASGSCLEEAGGPHSLYFAPDDIDELATTINRALADVPLQELMKLKGREYVEKFNSEKVSHDLMKCYLKTLGR